MNKDFQDAIELRLRQNFGPSKFATFMVRNIAQWEAISLKQLLEIIEIFKYDAPIYALFPFVYYYLDIDIYGMYSKLADEHNWDPEKVKRQIDSFSTHIVLASDNSTKLTFFKGFEKILREVSNRLIDEGAPPILPNIKGKV